MRMALVVGGLLVYSSATFAKDIPLEEKDQIIVGKICELAAKSPAVPIETTAQIAAWCVQWLQRMKEAPKLEAAKP